MDFSHILNRLHIDSLSDMQQHAAEAITRSDGDVVILSPTGSGKTLAFLLPLSAKIDTATDSVQAIVVVPSRELASQTDSVAKRLGGELRTMCCYGGRPTMDEHRQLRAMRPHIVIGTPGRLNDHLAKGNINAASVKIFVIDEYDKCLAMGFQDEMQRLVGSLPAVRQRILLSATPATPEGLRLLGISPHATTIDYRTTTASTSTEEGSQPDRIALYAVKSATKDKLETLRQLLLSRGDESSIVFLNYRESVERANAYLRQQGFVTSHLHGGMDQRRREDMLYRFANGSANILVATDLASRGLDIPNVQNIIHYHLPETADNYTHRIGRTARWQATGNAFFLLAPGEHVPEYVSPEATPHQPQPASEQPQPPRMATIYIGKGKKDKLSRGDIVGFLCKTAGLQGSDIGRIDVNERYTYAAVRRPLLAQVLERAQGHKIKGIKTLVEPVSD